MVKIVGQIVQLDPEKKYIMLIDKNVLSADDMQLLSLHLQKQEGSFLSITLPNFDAIRFVENSDRIVDVQLKEENKEEQKP